MSQGDQFNQFGYDHYLKAPKKTRGARSEYQSGRTGLLRSMQSPAAASVVLFAAAILFVWAVVATYPSEEARNRPIPIVKADLRPVKQKPENAGGMDIPNKKSTILARSGYPSIKDDREKIENLLAMKSNVPPMSKVEAISAIDNIADDKPSMSEKGLVLSSSDKAEDIDITSVDKVVELDISKPDVAKEEIPSLKPAFEIKEPKVEDILQKIGSTKNNDSSDVSGNEFNQKVAEAAIRSKPSYKGKGNKKPKVIHSAGNAPETLDYVRSVLGKAESSTAPHNIEPAAGVTRNPEITAGMYFVQLASITDPKRAASEWVKMQKKYPMLMQSKFRVQEASLSNGKFYRIQAGPMSKASANRICNELKLAKKPGGCLVVK